MTLPATTTRPPRGGAGTFLDKLAARSAATGTVLCLGLDPDPAALPAGFGADVAGVEAFVRLLLDAALPFAAAVKPNLAFYEALGSGGLALLERLRAAIPDDVPVILDVKRGDIGSTATRQAVALFDVLGADAVTVNPYLGAAAIEPLLERVDRFAYLLCRTSNPGAGDLQDLVVSANDATGAPAEPLWARVARLATRWGPGGTVGLVVGATAPAELRAIRSIAPGLPFLVPGLGAQGGDLDAVTSAGPTTAPPAAERPGRGLLVNVSRGIAGAAADHAGGASPADPASLLANAARSWAQRLPVLR
ncbi:MAG TPA: orotidine-5'-phosphate decarboxylase [Candidatus Limnocylindrales bacterium]